jgi:DNA-binding response OmpR family regulator
MRDQHYVQANDLAGTKKQPQARATHRILVVEDDPDILQLNTAVLSQSGYLVETAADGATAWDLLQLDTFDLLVTDNEMPGVTGLELLKKMRAARMIVPVIMATGAEPREEFARDPWLRPAATLNKPYTLDELLGTVRKILRATEVENERERPAPAREEQYRPTADRLRAG